MKKTYIYIIAAVVILAVVGFVLMHKTHDSTPVAMPTLSAQDRVVYEKRQQQSQAVIKQFTDKTAPSDKFIWYQALARADFGLQDYQGSKDAYLAAFASDPKNPLTGQTEAEFSGLLVVMGDHDGARDAIQKALSLRPDVTDYWKAYIALEIKYFNSSPAHIGSIYQDAIKKSRNQMDLLAAYAKYLEQNGDLSGALAEWKVALKIYPSNQDAAANITRLEKLVK